MTIGQLIRQRRQELGLSQEELANRLGNKSRASVSTVENDKEDLTTDRIRKYAEALQTTPAYLMGWEANDIGEASRIIPEAIQKNEHLKKYYERLANKINEEEALDLYSLYQQASPEVKKAVEVLLKFEPPQA